MENKAVVTDRAPEALGPYSQGIVAGNMVFTAGEIPVDPKTGAVPETVAEQADLALRNLIAVVEGAGATVRDIVSVTVYLSDIQDFAEVNRVYAEHFVEPYPARSCIAAAALPKGVRIMVSAIAVKN
ncbi:MAG: Rid family detoxifying hydrolase [archaeon]|nr:Rid family detoxifying hydrolase [archaeon]